MNLLFVDSCVRGKEISRTYALCEKFMEELKKKHSELQVKTITVYREDIKPIDPETLKRRDALEEEKKLDDPMFDYAHEFAAADYILIGAPYWDYSFPACLKIYIELTSATGIAFGYTEAGSAGLCKAKKMLYLSTAGGRVPEIHAGEEYMRQICKFYGIPVFEGYCVQELDIDGADIEGKMKAALTHMSEVAADYI